MNVIGTPQRQQNINIILILPFIIKVWEHGLSYGKGERGCFFNVTFLRSDTVTASEKQVGGNHYSKYAIQPSEFIFKNELDWLQGNVIKYVCRHKYKGHQEDIKKAIHYLELILEWYYQEGTDE